MIYAKFISSNFEFEIRTFESEQELQTEAKARPDSDVVKISRAEVIGYRGRDFVICCDGTVQPANRDCASLT